LERNKPTKTLFITIFSSFHHVKQPIPPPTPLQESREASKSAKRKPRFCALATLDNHITIAISIKPSQPAVSLEGHVFLRCLLQFRHQRIISSAWLRRPRSIAATKRSPPKRNRSPNSIPQTVAKMCRKSSREAIRTRLVQNASGSIAGCKGLIKIAMVI